MYPTGFFSRQSVVAQIQDSVRQLQEQVANTGSGGSGGGGVSSEVLANYVLKTELPAAPNLSAYAYTTQLTPLALKTDVEKKADVTQLPNMSLYVKTADLPSFPDLSAYAYTTQLTPLALKTDLNSLSTTVNTKANLTALADYVKTVDLPAMPDLSGYALTTTVNSKAEKTYVDTQLALKANQTALADYVTGTDFNTRVNPYISNWLTTYINANPNSWVSLRTLLQYYPLTYAMWTSPTHEFVARDGERNGDVWKRFSDTGYTGSSSLCCANGYNVFSTVTATTTKPIAFRKKTHQFTGDAMIHRGMAIRNKGTIFVVYSWVTSPEASRIIFTGTGNTNNINTPTGANIGNDTGPRFRLTRDQFILALEAGGTSTFSGPPVVDTEIGMPYILGFSWDFSLNPPRFIWINNRYAIEHLGPSTETERLEITDTGLIPTVVTSWNIPYSAWNATTTRTAVYNWFGTTVNSGTAVDCHNIGHWDNTYMSMEQMRTIHIRLLQRYCVPPFPASNYRLSDELS
jgi:hypothetical protein